MLLLACLPVKAQRVTTVKKTADSITIAAGTQYQRAKYFKWLFGEHYRRDWLTPVTLPVLHLDQLGGGVTPYEEGGGRQTKTLKLHDKAGREYVLRSVDKTYGKAIDEIYRGTFVERVVDDQVSSAQPYGALTVAGMAEAANIYHTNPIIGYLPKQPALGQFNDEYADDIYLFEQRPDGNWETEEDFANSSNIISTEKVLDELLEDNDASVDQQQYIRSRLFDIVIGDWGRHEDQWRWGKTKKGDKTIYEPIPRDRDQTFTKFDGAALRVAAKDHHQTFDHKLKDVKGFGFPARDLDRRMANLTTLGDWMQAAADVQQALTDEVIDENISRLPPEIYAISGKDITAKVKSRRDALHNYARDYYLFLAEEVDIPGTYQNEKFQVSRLSDSETVVEVFKIGNQGDLSTTPTYSRKFLTRETKEIRLYGISGNDIFELEGRVEKGIKVRVIGGLGKDSISDWSKVGSTGSPQKTIVYDNPGNAIVTSSETKLKLSDDTAINAYRYYFYEYDKSGIKPIFFYNNADRFHVGLGYKIVENKWRKAPAHEQYFLGRYSLTQNAIGATYRGTFYQFPGKWNTEIVADYDAVRWTNFFGLGNETDRTIDDANYYRVRNSEILFSVGLNRKFGTAHELWITPLMQAIKIIRDRDRFLETTVVPNGLELYERHYYAGGTLNYAFTDVDDIMVPTKGVGFFASGSYLHNLAHTERSFARINGGVQLYIPLFWDLSLAMVAAGTEVEGDPEFYQLPTVGGSRTIRGLRRDRFRGNIAFYNDNELQWIKDVRWKIMNGKVGVLALMDNGRVWLDGEDSDKWHFTYGGGVILSPFNLVKATATYAFSEDGSRFTLRLTRDINPF
ncbi:hypothetical protein [Polluticoccus soli]|uniref:hypothetical protein n=1 Tax=Polluticoccus soli TaxID=3034150 RepID=UPI0023E1EB75|nr:hypothetical protein [Flavipsychrobacter sp. JY13-12]